MLLSTLESLLKTSLHDESLPPRAAPGAAASLAGGLSPEWEQQLPGSGGPGGGPVTRLLRETVARLQQLAPATALLRGPP